MDSFDLLKTLYHASKGIVFNQVSMDNHIPHEQRNKAIKLCEELEKVGFVQDSKTLTFDVALTLKGAEFVERKLGKTDYIQSLLNRSLKNLFDIGGKDKEVDYQELHCRIGIKLDEQELVVERLVLKGWITEPQHCGVRLTEGGHRRARAIR